ncbi:ABC transporter substrate-binding protein [Bradyrhizobium sp. CSA207]|uniref:ABC transporter substrate-binding protein n=1 Tax=Bradyrhizobium sp. CSA207 TaxID=2698826 RepID=UPI0023AF58DD|nr:ABC transporter substrate-binding protein [Bradyrhizobium sp. CSA207]MDE5445785.1 ABC transporter substrate-binding protein [Bradyrhizobium sp. CSA207]
MKRTLTICAATGLALILSGQVALAEVKIGAVVSTTGPASFLGEPQKQTLELYVKELNDKGGINGEPVKLVLYDDGSDANASRTFATRLVEEDRVDAVVGGSGTGNSLAMIPVFEDAQIPYVSFSGGVEIIDPVRKWVFKPPHTDLMACQKIYEDMKKRGISKIAIIAGQGGFAKSMEKQCKRVASNYGISILMSESYGPRDSDVTPQLNRIKASTGVQAVLNPDIGQGPAIVTRNFHQLGMGAQLYLSHAAATSGYLKAVGSDANGALLPAPSLLVAEALPESDPLKKVLTGYKTLFEKSTGKEADAFGGYARDSFLLLADAMKRAGTKEKTAVRDALEATKGFLGTVGTINMSPTDHLGIDLSSFKMLKVVDAKWGIAD